MAAAMTSARTPTPTLQTVVCVQSNIQDIPRVVSKVRDFIIEAAPDMF
jgi:hypothetical protein